MSVDTTSAQAWHAPVKPAASRPRTPVVRESAVLVLPPMQLVLHLRLLLERQAVPESWKHQSGTVALLCPSGKEGLGEAMLLQPHGSFGTDNTGAGLSERHPGTDQLVNLASCPSCQCRCCVCCAY